MSREALWEEVANRLATARSYWLATTDPSGGPHTAPVWGVVLDDALYLYSERRTAKARNVGADPRVVVHLENAEDVVIVHGVLEDLGRPGARADVLQALSAKYSSPEDAQYLPTTDPDFDVLWCLRPLKALLWQLADYDATQARWHAG